jgi:hypothetical protein
MALDIFKQFATDDSLENNGTWFEIGGGASLLVARNGNRKYARIISKLVEQHRKVLDLDDELSEKKNEEIMIEAMANALLLGWKNIEYKGEKLEYSVENAKKLLAIRDFRSLVMRLSDDTNAYRLKEDEEQGEA